MKKGFKVGTALARPLARFIVKDKSCQKCLKKNQEFYLWDLSWCANCRRKWNRIKGRKRWSENKVENNRRALANYYKHRERYRNSDRARWQKIKDSVFERYGGHECKCCGENNSLFLTIDHVNGGGTKQRRELGGGGMFNYRWIYMNNYPAGYQVLCMNCNWGKGQNLRRNGINKCPHEN